MTGVDFEFKTWVIYDRLRLHQKIEDWLADRWDPREWTLEVTRYDQYTLIMIGFVTESKRTVFELAWCKLAFRRLP